ncbi:hypothetical protein [Actinoplanes sp. NPDC051859]|uniref:hypothetical protein n=1 Tax=Actinoplanes sp. NPDC051859 TaxID=3363909 RepID=UPI003792693F
MTNDSLGRRAAPVSPADVLIARLKECRRLAGWSALQLAEQLAALGATKLTANILRNLEAGRRQQAVSVEELLLLALALQVPPEALLAPREGDRIDLMPGLTVEGPDFLAWLRGEQPLPGTETDPEWFRKAAATAFGEHGGMQVSATLRAEFLQRASAAFDGFLAISDAMAEDAERKTRAQVRDLLTDIRTAVTDGASTDALVAQLDGYLAKLPATE